MRFIKNLRTPISLAPDFFVPEIVAHAVLELNAILAGGAIRSFFDKTKVADYDLFFLKESHRDATLQWLFDHATLVFECPERYLYTFKFQGIKIQCITRFIYPSIDILLESFDIRAGKMAVDDSFDITVSQDAIDDATNMHINIDKVMYPIATMHRIRKYIQKGYRFDSVEQLNEFGKLLANFDPKDSDDWAALYID